MATGASKRALDMGTARGGRGAASARRWPRSVTPSYDRGPRPNGCLLVVSVGQAREEGQVRPTAWLGLVRRPGWARRQVTATSSARVGLGRITNTVTRHPRTRRAQQVPLWQPSQRNVDLLAGPSSCGASAALVEVTAAWAHATATSGRAAPCATSQRFTTCSAQSQKQVEQMQVLPDDFFIGLQQMLSKQMVRMQMQIQVQVLLQMPAPQAFL